MPEQAVWGALTAAMLGLVALGALVVVAVTTDALLAGGAVRRSRVISLAAPWRSFARLLRQRTRTLPNADGLLWGIGRFGLPILAALIFSLVPLGAHAVISTSVGVVIFNALDVGVWVVVWLLGWGANSAFSLMGGYRFLALAIAYELPLMFALTSPAIAAGSLDAAVIADSQHPLWYAAMMPIAFVIYCVAAIAFSVSGPFAAPVATDIAGGAGSELSGVDRLLVDGGRYAMLAASAAFAVPMFLGGGAGPLLPGWAWTLVKSAVVLVALIVVRRQLPIIRPERFLQLGWMILLPLAVLQAFVVSLGAVFARGG